MIFCFRRFRCQGLNGFIVDGLRCKAAFVSLPRGLLCRRQLSRMHRMCGRIRGTRCRQANKSQANKAKHGHISAVSGGKKAS